MPSSLKAHILTIYCFLVNLFKLVPVIFTYLRALCRGFISKHSATGSCHRVESRRVGSGHGSKFLTRFHLWRDYPQIYKRGINPLYRVSSPPGSDTYTPTAVVSYSSSGEKYVTCFGPVRISGHALAPPQWPHSADEMI